jgi:hypothetical protein
MLCHRSDPASDPIPTRPSGESVSRTSVSTRFIYVSCLEPGVDIDGAESLVERLVHVRVVAVVKPQGQQAQHVLSHTLH